MRLISTIFLVGAALIGVGRAASLAELVGQLPACGVTCLETAVAASSCSLTDSACICSDTDLLALATACLATSCTIPEQLKVAHIQGLGCGVPIYSNQTKVRVVIWLFCILAEVCVVIRIYTKWKVTAKVSPDDWAIIASALGIIPFWYLALTLVDLGLGKNMWDTNIDELDKFFRIFWAEEMLYLILLGMTKIAIVLFLVNIFPSRTFRMMCWAIGPISIIWTQWRGTATADSCNNLNLQTYISGAVNIIQDFTILALPVYELYKLQVSLRKKIQLFLMFSVGLFVSMIKDYVELVIWSVIEPTLAIVCACMPSLRQLFGHLEISKFFMSTNKDKSAFSSAGNSRIYQNRSFKIENKLRSKNDDFYELTGETNVDVGSNSSVHANGSGNPGSNAGSQHPDYNGNEDEHKSAAHVWTPNPLKGTQK
ncbi:hypothetical protein BP6252_06532 [Coleophoma cylindrospora]|uniref:Uncharacterized protein n=1 Tax=Coleophoma cylindrospora TaxID=1849047 RepID=A0A3D8RN68_9HELO|nr:hypothetical protein BP6252_06532 [Coleophoma cylindrospora]